MQIINFINKAPRKIMLWTVVYGGIYEIIIYPLSYHHKYGYFPSLDWKEIILIVSALSVLSVCRTYEKKQRLTK